MVQNWPLKEDVLIKSGRYNKEEIEFELIKEIIIAIRNARSKNKVEPVKKIKAVIYAGNKKELIESQTHLIKNLRTGLSELEVKEKGEKLVGAIYAAVGDVEIYLIGAVDKEKEKVRLKKEISNFKKIIKAAKGRLANQEFIDKAPPAVVAKEKNKLESRRAELKKLAEQLKYL